MLLFISTSLKPYICLKHINYNVGGRQSCFDVKASNPSISPFSPTYQGLGHGESSLMQILPFPSHFLELFQGGTEAFPSQLRGIISPACHGSALGPPACRTCLNQLTERVPWRHPDQMPKPFEPAFQCGAVVALFLAPAELSMSPSL